MAETAAAKPNMREMLEIISGQSLDDNFYQRPDAQELVSKASNVLYGDIGANMDARDWGAIMKSPDVYAAARDGLKTMYSDPSYMVANTKNLMAQGYLPEQADYTYQQMQGRVGSTYSPNWSAGSEFAGKIDTPGYLAGVRSAGNDQAAIDSFTNSYWQKYGGNPMLTKSGGVVDAGTSTANPGLGQTTTPITPPTGGVVTPGVNSPSPITPTPTGSVTGGGLITNANNLSGGFISPLASQTGNVNSGGLISGAAKQLFTNPVTVQAPSVKTVNPFATTPR
jgi:hypothetical protein